MNPLFFRFSIDRGGTFTDVYAEIPGEAGFRVVKLLSEDPENYADAPREGIRKVLEEMSGQHVPAEGFSSSRIEWIRMGTTVATNALLERKGARTLLLITRGFRDLLQIGNQTRPDLFDLEIRKPELLYERVHEVDERVRLLGSGEDPEGRELVEGTTGESFLLLKKPDLSELEPLLNEAYQVLDQKAVPDRMLYVMDVLARIKALLSEDHIQVLGPKIAELIEADGIVMTSEMEIAKLVEDQLGISISIDEDL